MESEKKLSRLQREIMKSRILKEMDRNPLFKKTIIDSPLKKQSQKENEFPININEIMTTKERFKDLKDNWVVYLYIVVILSLFFFGLIFP